MSALLQALRNAVSLLEAADLDYMVIGGYALPHYGRTRSTLDVDVAVRIGSAADFRAFLDAATARGFTLSIASYLNPVCLMVDGATGLEIEFWTRPDGVEWDDETLRRRRRVAYEGLAFWVVSPEDFIVSKLARPDRSEQDEMDVASVLQRVGSEIDGDYLEARARKFGVHNLLGELRRRLPSQERLTV